MKENQIVAKHRLCGNNPELLGNHYRYVFYNPGIAEIIKAGQFNILMVDESGERIPLTMNDADSKTGLVTIVFAVVGVSTYKLAKLEKGNFLYAVCGPLGKASEIEKNQVVAGVFGGTGAAVGLAVMKANKQAGNYVITILGARNSDLLILEDEFRAISDEVIVCTDDGSKGIKGFVTTALEQKCETGKIDKIIAIGPGLMMQACVNVGYGKYNIPVIVSLDSIMVDGTGMCGECSLTVGGSKLFCCVDGPEFPGNLINWTEYYSRKKAYHEKETASMAKILSGRK